MKFYVDDSKELPVDLVDYYLKERFNIILGSKKQRRADSSESATSDQPTADVSSDKQDQETTNIESRARILENPVYQKMPFYPYKDLLMWQEVEKQRIVNSGKQRNDFIYQHVRNTYMQ